MGTLLTLLLLAAGATGAGAQELVIDERSQWLTWKVPQGVVDLGADGSLRLRRFQRKLDPLLNMRDFAHETRERGVVPGGITALSDRQSVGELLDRDEGTWWQPDPADGLQRWVVEVDLGRLDLVEKIRLVFPDTSGARPFRHFAVYASEGMPVWDGRDQIRYRQVYATVLGNTAPVVDVDLVTRDPVGGHSQAVGENMVTADSLSFRPIQYIRFVPRQMSADAALAEIEAVSVGENLALGTLGRGGGIRSSQKFERTAPNLFDGSAEKFWLANAAKAAEREWQVGGQYFEWDLGVAFWLSQIVLYAWPPPDLGQTDFQAGSGPLGHEIEVSDGTPIPQGRPFRGPYDYERITLVDNQAVPRRWIFQHPFAARKTRYIFYHHDNWGGDGGWGFKVWEAFLYAPGYPAAVALESEMIPLESVKSFTRLTWDAELPPGTSVEVRTKSGDQISSKTLYFDRNGVEVDKDRYENVLKAFQRGETRQIPFEGEDWSAWTDPYQVSGEAFKSPSPRGFVRFKVTLATDDPEVTPVLRSLRLGFQDPLFRRTVEAEVFPRESRVGQWQEFRLLIRPSPTRGDVGFDGIWLPLAAPVRDVAVRIGGNAVAGIWAEMADDTLKVGLSTPVTRDSVEVRFSARLLHNPTFMAAVLAHSGQPGVTQTVKPAQRVGDDALAVFLPDLAGSDDVIANLSSGVGVVTPNGDGLNDELVLTFDLLRVDVVPEVEIFDLGGRLVRRLAGGSGSVQRVRWDGRDNSGAAAAPGLYLCRIAVRAGVGTRTATEVIHVAY